MELSDVKRNYDRVAPRYDLWTDLVFGRLLRIERYRQHTVDLLGDITGATVLDIGCGTGRNFAGLIQRVGPTGRLIGLDYSEGMLAQARGRAERAGWGNVELIHSDAATLEGVSEPVDAVVSVWCMGIVHDIEAALHRAVAVLRPGGRLAIMDFGRARPNHGPLRWLYPVYSAILKRSGIDSAEDLDDAKLQAKWNRGRIVLREGLDDLREGSYLWGGGLLLSGTARAKS